MKARLLDLANVDWGALDAYPDRTVFQTREWLHFIAETQEAVPVIAELREGREVAGYFSGLTFHRFGIRMLGSSFPGWTTPYIGFNLLSGASCRAALAAVQELAFGDLKCLHLEVSDRHLSLEDGESLGFEHGFFRSYETDLGEPEERILNAMTGEGRRCVRRAAKNGVVVEEAHDVGFADDYYHQLQDVFRRQKLVPTYGVERVRALIKHLLPTGNLLLLRARGPDNRCLACAIYPGMNKLADFWGGSSYADTHALRPNEALHWYALCYWKRSGAEVFDWGGGGIYKERFGPRPIAIPWFYKSKFKLLGALRSQAQQFAAARQRLIGRLCHAPEPEVHA
ncbi:MAG: GNAT family N-acetyltransferase [Candidatus Sulfotelmatobacter sp.]